MNSTSLYVTTNQIILKSNPSNPSTWYDLYRLVPYLRNSLCCVVCGNLLVDPLTPSVGPCQHHLCRRCVGGRKKIKPACSWCKNCNNYKENLNLRILLQCYKKMCMALTKSHIFHELLGQASKTDSATTGVERGAGNLIILIKEGAAFQDNYESKGGLPKSTYSILPCIYTNSSTQTLQLPTTIHKNDTINNLTNEIKNGTPLYSVMFAGTGNKITIKRKPKELTDIKLKTNQIKRDVSEKIVFKKPSTRCSTKPKRGCRCGNATLTPGKLTCCGQRCPCYVDNKACTECKCRGCRNPHRPDGNKVRPIIPQLQQQIQCQLPPTSTQPNLKIENLNLNSNFNDLPNNNQRFTTSYEVLDIPTSLLQASVIEENDADNLICSSADDIVVDFISND